MRTLIAFLFCLSVSIANAQELIIKSVVASNEPMLHPEQHLDLNGTPCALIKVKITGEDVNFTGNIIGKCEKTPDCYDVYLTTGSRSLNIHYPYIPTKMLIFRDYGINRVKSSCVYVVELGIDERTLQAYRPSEIDVSPEQLCKKAEEYLSRDAMSYDDWFNSKTLYEKAAASFYAEAEYGLFIVYNDPESPFKDSNKAKEYIIKSADHGYHDAQGELAGIYMDGNQELGFTKDLTKANKYWEMAASQGDPVASYCLGINYLQGNGVPKNMSEAFFWIDSSSRAGLWEAQGLAAEFYEKGIATKKDLQKAAELRKLAESGQKEYNKRNNIKN